MTARFSPVLEFEAFAAAVGAALVCGALSTLVPLLVAPTATLAALAVAGWTSRLRRRGSLTRTGIGLGSFVALGLLGGAALAFADPPAPLVSLRGLLLAAGLLPLFVAERHGFGSRAPVFTSP